jgi:glucose-6-phosphate-specific signal transduction histidine kinase
MKANTLHLAGLFVVTGLIGWLDYITGDELDLFILYIVPIAYGAWKFGRSPGVILSVTSAALWYAANAFLGHAYTRPLVGLWGGLVMLATFVAAALATDHIHQLLEQQRTLNSELADALAKVKRLSGRVPICMACKSIQEEDGAWKELEEYFTIHSENDFVFSHSICPHCKQPHAPTAPVALAAAT